MMTTRREGLLELSVTVLKSGVLAVFHTYRFNTSWCF